MLKHALIVCMLVLPSFVCAAENAPDVKALTPAISAVPVAPPQITVAAPAEAAPKAVAAIQPVRVGYVDIIRISTESEQGKALKTLLTAKKDELQGKISSRQKQIEKLKTSIEAKLSTMTQKQRDAKAKEFQKKVEEFQKFAQGTEEEFLALQDKESKTLFEAIEQAAGAHGKASGFAAIVIKKELLYVGGSVEAVDVTDALIKALNQGVQKK